MIDRDKNIHISGLKYILPKGAFAFILRKSPAIWVLVDDSDRS